MVQYIHCEPKNRTLDFCPKLFIMLTDSQNSCIDKFISKFAIKSFLNILSHIKAVATLPCEITVNLKHVL